MLNMHIKLKSLREECGGCPTHFSGETTDGKHFDAYLRHGFMKVEVAGVPIVETNPSHLDGVCSFSDFKEYAARKGFFLDDSDATRSSSVEDLEKTLEELYKDKVWVEFTQDFYSKTQDKTYKKGQKYTASIELAETLVEFGLAFIDDHSYEKKRRTGE